MSRRIVCLLCVLFASSVLAEDADVYQLIQKRLELMDEVAAYKWINKLPVEDLAREAVVLQNATIQSLKVGIRIEHSKQFFLQQIEAAKEIQRYWYSYWENNPAPENAPDLRNVVRPELTRLGNEIISNLLQTQAVHPDKFFTELTVEGLSEGSKKRLYAAVASISYYDNQLEQILSSGVLRVGTTGDYAPFSFRVPAETNFNGIDIDLARDLARTFGVQILFVQTTWSSLLEDLKTGNFDIAMSGVSRDMERQKVGYFSDPYHTGGKTPISRCEDKDNFDSLDKIDTNSTRVIVNPGGTNERFVDSRVKRARKILHADNRSVFDEIINHNADVMITDSIEVQLQVSKHVELCPTMPAQTLTFQEKGYLMPQDIELKEYVDLWLASRIGDGTVKKTFLKHLN